MEYTDGSQLRTWWWIIRIWEICGVDDNDTRFIVLFFFLDKLENYGALIIVLFFSNEMNLKLGAFGILLLT